MKNFIGLEDDTNNVCIMCFLMLVLFASQCLFEVDICDPALDQKNDTITQMRAKVKRCLDKDYEQTALAGLLYHRAILCF
jgi:hypothetical protein